MDNVDRERCECRKCINFCDDKEWYAKMEKEIARLIEEYTSKTIRKYNKI